MLPFIKTFCDHDLGSALQLFLPSPTACSFHTAQKGNSYPHEGFLKGRWSSFGIITCIYLTYILMVLVLALCAVWFMIGVINRKFHILGGLGCFFSGNKSPCLCK
jgi:hypothetical protein